MMMNHLTSYSLWQIGLGNGGSFDKGERVYMRMESILL